MITREADIDNNLDNTAMRFTDSMSSKVKMKAVKEMKRTNPTLKVPLESTQQIQRVQLLENG